MYPTPKSETESERRRRLWFVVEGGVVQLELVQSVPEIHIVVAVDGVEAGEHHRLRFHITRKRLGRGVGAVGDWASRLGV